MASMQNYSLPILLLMFLWNSYVLWMSSCGCPTPRFRMCLFFLIVLFARPTHWADSDCIRFGDFISRQLKGLTALSTCVKRKFAFVFVIWAWVCLCMCVYVTREWIHLCGLFSYLFSCVALFIVCVCAPTLVRECVCVVSWAWLIVCICA